MIIFPHSSSLVGQRTQKAASLGVAVEDHLLDAILTGAIPPGSSLKEVELSQSLGISSTPIREALSRLAQTGLVEVFTNKAKRVSVLNDAEVIDLLEYRALVTNKAYAQALEKLSQTSLSQLSYRLDAMRTAARIRDRRETLRAVFQFDALLIKGSGSPEALRIIQSRNSYLARHILLVWPDWLETGLVEQHASFLAALTEKRSIPEAHVWHWLLHYVQLFMG